MSHERVSFDELKVHDNWQKYAACLDEDPELFFPDGTSPAYMEQIENAKQVCRTCRVSKVCLTASIVTDARFGVWGAMTENERKPMLIAWAKRKTG
jgi:WhiB family redox-sensing transcriptional regulator